MGFSCPVTNQADALKAVSDFTGRQLEEPQSHFFSALTCTLQRGTRTSGGIAGSIVMVEFIGLMSRPISCKWN